MIAPDGTPRLAASHLGIFCLPMTHKKDAMLIWVDTIEVRYITPGDVVTMQSNT